jgi:hypothetical protein
MVFQMFLCGECYKNACLCVGSSVEQIHPKQQKIRAGIIHGVSKKELYNGIPNVVRGECYENVYT